MTIKEALTKGIEILKNANIGTPALEAGVLLCHVLKCDRSFIYAHGEDMVSLEDEGIYLNGIIKRAEGMPLQYITGIQEFMSLEFEVNSSVLIPRQDTEILVEAICVREPSLDTRTRDRVGGRFSDTLKILDIGTGSGCVAISLAYYMRNSHITAVDISQRALETARRNAVRNNVSERIAFINSDLFSALGEDYKRYFDVIVSNPPYIPAKDIWTLQTEVKDYEPETALDGGEDGLDFYRRITLSAIEFIKPNGLLAFEVGYNQSKDVSDIMDQYFEDIKILKDLSGIERVVIGWSRSKY